MAKKIQLKRGTAAVLASVNPKPAAGEAIVETDTGKVKIGDGVQNYNDLPYSDDGNVKANAISNEEAGADGKFSTTAVQGDAEKVVNMAQLRTLQENINDATHEVSGDVADATGTSQAAGADDATTGTSLEASKAMNTRIKALEDADIDGGEITAPAGGSD